MIFEVAGGILLAVCRRQGGEVDDAAFRRYRLCCAAVHAGLDETFDWGANGGASQC
jgi:hypothetical protein